MSTLRPYRAQDRDACLALFDSNTPAFFDPCERAGFDAFLHDPAQTSAFQVIERERRIVACGGLGLDASGSIASFAWGMVEHGLHGQGLGRQLTNARLAAARALPGVTRVRLCTSQHTQGFYAAFGFQVQNIVPDGYGPGLDEWEMVLQLGHVAG